MDFVVTNIRVALLVAVLSLAVVRLLASRYIYGISRFKGPVWASFTDVWRVLYYYSNTDLPFQGLHEKYGPIVRIGPRALAFSSPQAVRDIFGPGKIWQKSHAYFANIGVVKGRLAPTLFSSTDIEYHKHVRRAINSIFTVSSVASYEPFVEKTIGTFVHELDKRFVDREGPEGSVDLPTWLSFYAFDSISELTYSKPHGFIIAGRDFYGITEWVATFLGYGYVAGQMPALDMSLRHNPILMWLERKGLYNGITFPGAVFAQERIKERVQERKLQKSERTKDEMREDLLDKFLRAREERPEIMTDREVLGSSISMIIAGAETSAISLTAIFYYVLRTPGCYAKLESELFQHLQRSGLAAEKEYLPTVFSESFELPYLHACVQEAFRMHPALGMLSERIVPPSGAVICGEFIPGGTLVGCNPWVEQRDKIIFGNDSDVYRPERWLESEEKKHAMERAMFNFGAGNHVCVGQNIARMNIYKLVPSLIRTYEITLENPEKEWRVINGANMKQTDVNVRLKKRHDIRSNTIDKLDTPRHGQEYNL